MTLTDREILVLKQCAGQVVQLPYDAETAEATRRLEREGLIRRCMEDDQPTAIATFAGKLWLKDTDNG